jgi:hypothetical protein
MTTIVTNCSKRKRFAPGANLLARSLNQGSLDAVTSEWGERVAASEPLVEASRLYSGRPFHEALQASSALMAEILIVSAGLGVLRPCDLVPSYSLTVATGASDNILGRVDDEVVAGDWWRVLTREPYSFRSLDAALALVPNVGGLILIALPSPYLSMVEHELEQFSPERFSRTRVFTSPSFRFHDVRLHQLLMPYDARLDGPDSPSSGTATDFASRALRDFATFVLPAVPDGNREQHATAVSGRLEGWTAAVRPKRTRQSDSELIDIIRANWSMAGASCSQMLRRVRSELGLACEQGRMRNLHAAVRKEMEEVP